eukprot:gb/GECG01009974.1/.p1 GENE.gb/GECG01009974.1/~~gb/GECG01009974.1/.p1  ORF type:complete len:1677 (+),score=232.97 gb/GECG01009974.1/:1-5031(+)
MFGLSKEGNGGGGGLNSLGSLGLGGIGNDNNSRGQDAPSSTQGGVGLFGNNFGADPSFFSRTTRSVSVVENAAPTAAAGHQGDHGHGHSQGKMVLPSGVKARVVEQPDLDVDVLRFTPSKGCLLLPVQNLEQTPIYGPGEEESAASIEQEDQEIQDAFMNADERDDEEVVGTDSDTYPALPYHVKVANKYGVAVFATPEGLVTTTTKFLNKVFKQLYEKAKADYEDNSSQEVLYRAIQACSFFPTDGWVTQVELSPDELSVAIVSESETATTLYCFQLRDLLLPKQGRKPSPCGTRQLDKDQSVKSLSFSKDSSMLALCQNDDELLILSRLSGGVLHRKTIDGISCATWDYAGHILFGTTDGSVQCFDYHDIDSEPQHFQTVTGKPENLESRDYAVHYISCFTKELFVVGHRCLSGNVDEDPQPPPRVNLTVYERILGQWKGFSLGEVTYFSEGEYGNHSYLVEYIAEWNVFLVACNFTMSEGLILIGKGSPQPEGEGGDDSYRVDEDTWRAWQRNDYLGKPQETDTAEPTRIFGFGVVRNTEWEISASSAGGPERQVKKNPPGIVILNSVYVLSWHNMLGWNGYHEKSLAKPVKGDIPEACRESVGSSGPATIQQSDTVSENQRQDYQIQLTLGRRDRTTMDRDDGASLGSSSTSTAHSAPTAGFSSKSNLSFAGSQPAAGSNSNMGGLKPNAVHSFNEKRSEDKHTTNNSQTSNDGNMEADSVAKKLSEHVRDIHEAIWSSIKSCTASDVPLEKRCGRQLLTDISKDLERLADKSNRIHRAASRAEKERSKLLMQNRHLLHIFDECRSRVETANRWQRDVPSNLDPYSAEIQRKVHQILEDVRANQQSVYSVVKHLQSQGNLNNPVLLKEDLQSLETSQDTQLKQLSRLYYWLDNGPFQSYHKEVQSTPSKKGVNTKPRSTPRYGSPSRQSSRGKQESTGLAADVEGNTFRPITNAFDIGATVSSLWNSNSTQFRPRSARKISADNVYGSSASKFRDVRKLLAHNNRAEAAIPSYNVDRIPLAGSGAEANYDDSSDTVVESLSRSRPPPVPTSMGKNQRPSRSSSATVSSLSSFPPHADSASGSVQALKKSSFAFAKASESSSPSDVEAVKRLMLQVGEDKKATDYFANHLLNKHQEDSWKILSKQYGYSVVSPFARQCGVQLEKPKEATPNTGTEPMKSSSATSFRSTQSASENTLSDTGSSNRPCRFGGSNCGKSETETEFHASTGEVSETISVGLSAVPSFGDGFNIGSQSLPVVSSSTSSDAESSTNTSVSISSPVGSVSGNGLSSNSSITVPTTVTTSISAPKDAPTSGVTQLLKQTNAVSSDVSLTERHVEALRQFYQHVQPGKQIDIREKFQQYGIGIWDKLARKYPGKVSPFKPDDEANKGGNEATGQTFGGMSATGTSSGNSMLSFSSVSTGGGFGVPASATNQTPGVFGKPTLGLNLGGPSTPNTSSTSVQGLGTSTDQHQANFGLFNNSSVAATQQSAVQHPFSAPRSFEPSASQTPFAGSNFGAQSSTNSSDSEQHLQALKRFFQDHKPQKVNEAEDLFKKYGFQIWSKLDAKYREQRNPGETVRPYVQGLPHVDMNAITGSGGGLGSLSSGLGQGGAAAAMGASFGSSNSGLLGSGQSAGFSGLSPPSMPGQSPFSSYAQQASSGNLFGNALSSNKLFGNS